MRNTSKKTPDKNLFENFGLDEILREGARKMLQTVIENNGV